MPAGKRKADFFDPNKSDSDDEDFAPGEDRPRKSAKKSRSHTKKSSSSRKRTKYRGSDVSDDDLDEESDLDNSFSEEEEEEEDIIMNEKTGRRMRHAAAKHASYEEPSEDDIEDSLEITDSDVSVKKPSKGRRTAAPKFESEDDDEDVPYSKPSKIITLKVKTPQPLRTTRATSVTARSTRGGTSVEPTSAGLTRRNTRQQSRDPDAAPLVSLSDSGKHVIRESGSPESLPRSRATRGSKGTKMPASTIKEEVKETSSYEDPGKDDSALVEDDEPPPVVSDLLPAEDEEMVEADTAKQNDAVVIDADDEDDEDEEGPVVRTGRTRGTRAAASETGEKEDAPASQPARETRRSTRTLRKGGKNSQEQSSDFEPHSENGSGDDLSGSDASPKKSKAASEDDGYGSSPVRRGRGAARGKSKSTSRRRAASEEDEVDPDELAEELDELRAGNRKRRKIIQDESIVYEIKGRRERKPVDYSIKPMDQIYAQDLEEEEAAPTPTRRAKGGRNGASQPWERNLYTTFGPFGGAGGPPALIGGPWGTGATGGVDSDSSDDENMQRPNVGGAIGMTPTAAAAPGLLPGLAQTNNTDAMAAMGGNTTNLGKVKSPKALADADPLGVDQNVDFSKVGGLEGHIDQLKEMVQMPLLYPELFLKFHVTPPRGVLFHGPPGTGKTLVARALAAQVGSGGRKITFYMRKGADALSKWVGEAERQLRLLFEEARKTQPSIIFFDEIDGLAPVRSSKQEQIHASIVSTLLALMDGMDGRGQVIVIGATNRPDNIDPALRRPGRFDREFYFPLPDIEGRKSIINIHTKDWGIDNAFKESLAHVTKGYGGADLRALCTEAALNAIQRTYPQIYASNEKLIVNPDKIKVTAKDFMLSVKKMIPSSERSTSSGAAPLPKGIEPLLRDQLKKIEDLLDSLIPIKKKTTALQEALYEQYEDEDQGFGRETLQQDFEKSRVFRPRLLICGEPGMGQAYLGGALLNHFEGLHVQSFDLPTIFADSARSAETAIVQLFAEVKRHKPSVIFLPGIDTWYHTLSDAVITTFLGLLRGIPPTDPVLVLGITDTPPDKVDPALLGDLFGFSRKNRFVIERPSKKHREEFFQTIVSYVRKSPKDFPEPINRKKRVLEVLEVAPAPPPKPPTKEEVKALKKRDHQLLNLLKVQIQPIMDQIQKKYRKFRNPVIPQSQIQYLYDEMDPNHVRPDIPTATFRPFELEEDKTGVKGLRETSSGKFFYNLETTTIEERLSNGFYARPKDFLADIKSLAKDAKHIGDKERLLKANELLSNVDVDMAGIEANPMFADCENLYQRQLQRAKEREEKLRKRAQQGPGLDTVQSDLPDTGLEEQAEGPLILGAAIPPARPAALVTPFHTPSNLSNGYSADSQAHQNSNGASVPSRSSGADDVHMGGTDDSHLSQHTSDESQIHAYQQFPTVADRASNPANEQHTQLSQRSIFQPIPPNTSPHAFVNDASTTTSGKKTSDGWSTQATNGIGHISPSPVDKAGQDSQLPDTQRDSQRDTGASDNSSQEPWPHSQAQAIARGNKLQNYPSQTPSSGSQVPAVPHFNAPVRTSISRPAAIADILNDSPVEPNSSQASSQKDFILEDFFVEDLLGKMVDKSSGCSIEQLEQINRELMEALWKCRGEWNRNVVVKTLVNVFNETIQDMEEMQRILQASQSLQSQG
ncbi:hypothetical protein BP5796_06285 [Coleophoma crateriformis]|uniref:AAA+ ATPase domain-containing protein n=1 Tax=Coleophoma crateriformis TaxID=565419 RepID=A0A3D8RWK7_9HELO|nr:hypothetical protein BP5796_06285 [Coleophoma crateriformis]